MVALRRTELVRIREQVKRMGNPVETAAAWSYTWLGAAISVALSLIALYGSKTETSSPARWLFEVNWFALFTFSFLSFFCWYFDRQRRQTEQSDKDVVVREIESIEARY